MERETLRHPFPPTYDENSEILILGSFPSPKSRESGYFYGHPQNRFWRVMAALFDDTLPQTTEEKRAFLLRHHVAAWDVIAACTITGASDGSIADAVPNDLSEILRTAKIRRICCNGRTAWLLYQKHTAPLLGIDAVRLPSTSPANAAWSQERLTEAWRELTGLK